MVLIYRPSTDMETGMPAHWTQTHRLQIIVGLLLLCGAGVIAMFRLPLQLLPDLEEPSISIWTAWPGAAPSEIERAITEPQERVMRGLAGLSEISGNANAGNSFLQLTFAPGTDLDPVFVDVIGRLQRVPALPREATPPVVTRGSDGPERTLIYYFVQMLPGTEGPVERYQSLVEQKVPARLQQVPGVASARINSGPDSELRIEIDPTRAAALGIELPDLVATLSRLDDVSAGAVEFGRTSYALRLHGRFQPEALDQLPVGRIDGRVVRLSEIGRASFQRPDRAGFSYQNGNPALTLQLFRESNSNVLETLSRLDREVEAIREEVLTPAGLAIEKSFEPGIFIKRALGFLGGNLGLGLLAALACLWLFLRDLRATLLIAIAVPVSLCCTLLALAIMGRNLNMISIAGLAFAVGMVMDAAIVVVESALSELKRGADLVSAAVQGTRRVAGALLASTITTVAVFLPVLALKDVEGQVFADLAVTISIAVVISLAVALWVVPALLPMIIRSQSEHRLEVAWPTLARRLARMSQRSKPAWLLSAGLVVGPMLAAVWLAPPRDYLPPVKRAAVDAFLQMPPGMGADRIESEIVQPILARMRPYMEGKQEPKLLNYYIITWPNGGTLGARVQDPDRIGELESLLNNQILVGLPDLRAFAREGELFGSFGGGSRSIWINLQGADVEALQAAAARVETLVAERLPGAQIQINPSASADAVEIAVLPEDQRLAELGVNRAWLADTLRVLGDGRFLGEYFDGERRQPILLRAPVAESLEDLSATPVATPGGVVGLGDLAALTRTRSPAELRRVNFSRAVTVSISPSDSDALEDVLSLLEREVLPVLRQELPAGISLDVGGSAGKLEALSQSLLGNLALALLCLSLILMVMLRSAFDTLAVLATLPLAALGGVLGLRMLGWFVPQPLDLLTMIGFVMLLSMVVANAVLLVTETRAAEARGEALDRAIELALSERLRALTLGALTGVVGALPLAASPGPAAAIYRGLAAVTCGGVTLSLLLVAVLVPALLRLPRAWQAWRRRDAASTVQSSLSLESTVLEHPGVSS